MNYFSLIYFVCFANVIMSDVSKLDDINEHKKYAIIFVRAMKMEIADKGKFVDYPLYKMDDFRVSVISNIEDFWKFCARKLIEFDFHLEVTDSEVIFLSFYYKILQWLKYHLSFVQGHKVDNPEVTGAVEKIIKGRKIDAYIKAAFDEKIYDIIKPEELTSFGKTIDFALQLILNVEKTNARVFSSESKFKNGKEMFYEIVCCRFVRCKKIEVYEDFFQKVDNKEDYTNYDLSKRKLQLFGLIDITLITFRGELKQEIDYNSINLSDSVRGTVSHFKGTALLFMQAVENYVFRSDQLDKFTYPYRKAILENFSTRKEAFNLRLCSLNLQVQYLVNDFKVWYGTYKDELMKRPEIRVTFYRLLKWLSKYSKFQACSYAENEIDETLSEIHKLTPVSDDVLINTRIPRGINTLKQLVEFATKEGNTEDTSVEEDDFIVPQGEAFQRIKKPLKEPMDIESEEGEAETMEALPGKLKGRVVSVSPPRKVKQSSCSNFGECVNTSIKSLIGPPLRTIKNTIKKITKALGCS